MFVSTTGIQASEIDEVKIHTAHTRVSDFLTGNQASKNENE